MGEETLTWNLALNSTKVFLMATITHVQQTLKMCMQSWLWWSMSLFLALQRQWQKNFCVFQYSHSYIDCLKKNQPTKQTQMSKLHNRCFTHSLILRLVRQVCVRNTRISSDRKSIQRSFPQALSERTVNINPGSYTQPLRGYSKWCCGVPEEKNSYGVFISHQCGCPRQRLKVSSQSPCSGMVRWPCDKDTEE